MIATPDIRISYNDLPEEMLFAVGSRTQCFHSTTLYYGASRDITLSPTLPVFDVLLRAHWRLECGENEGSVGIWEI
jgi:hypothetical protein